MHGSPAMRSHAHAISYKYLNARINFLRTIGTFAEVQMIWIAGFCSSISRSEGTCAADTQSGGMDNSDVRRRHK